MKNYRDIVEQILYMENFGTPIPIELINKFKELYKQLGESIDEKYQADIRRLSNKYKWE